MILLAGASGFIGGNCARALAERGLEFVCLAHKKAPRLCGASRIIRADLLRKKSVMGIETEFDAVIHAAGDFDGRVTVKGTENLLELCVRLGNVRRFAYISSLDVLMTPGTAYATAKREAENMVMASGLDYMIVRPSMVYGPGDRFITPLLALFGRKGITPLVPVPGTGKELRRPLFVKDLAGTIADECAVLSGRRHLNIAGPEVLSVMRIAGLVKEASASSKSIVRIPRHVLRTMGIVSASARYAAENLVDKHSWNPSEEVSFGRTNFEEGLRLTIKILRGLA